MATWPSIWEKKLARDTKILPDLQGSSWDSWGCLAGGRLRGLSVCEYLMEENEEGGGGAQRGDKHQWARLEYRKKKDFP